MALPLVVCHQLRSPDNLGAVARLMANFGYPDLVLSDPVTHDFRGADKLGVGAEHILDGFAVAPSLPEALAGAVYAVGTTSRTVLKRFTPLSPEEGAARLLSNAARGRVALVLGGEKRGLSDDELACCHDVIVIPTPGPQPSMNLSQAAAVLFYVVARAFQQAAPSPAEEGAPGRTLQALEAKLGEALLRAEFLNPQAPGHVLKELVRSLVRNGLTKREAELWLSASAHLLRTLEARAPKDGATSSTASR